MAKAGGLWVVRGRKLEEIKWKSKGRCLGRVSTVSMKSRPVVGRQWATVDRSRAGEKKGPVGAGCWEWDRRQMMEEKSVSRGGYA